MNLKSLTLILALGLSASPAAAWESPKQAADAFCALLTVRNSNWGCRVEATHTRISVYQANANKFAVILAARLIGDSFCLSIKESLHGNMEAFTPGWRINVLSDEDGLVLFSCPLSEVLESVPPPQALEPIPGA